MYKSRSWPPNFVWELTESHFHTNKVIHVWSRFVSFRNRNQRRSRSNRTRGFHWWRCTWIWWTVHNLSISRKMLVELDHCIDPVTLDHRVEAHVWPGNPSIVDKEAQSPMVVDPDQPVPIPRRDKCSCRKMRQVIEGQRHSDGMAEKKLFKTVDWDRWRWQFRIRGYQESQVPVRLWCAVQHLK